MTFKVDDRIFETSVTTGTGTYTLDGPVTGYQAFSEMTANNYCPYFVTMDNSASWEAGIGQVLGSPARLARTHVLTSSNSDAAVNWGVGTKNVRCGLIAALGAPRVKSVSIAGGAGDQTLTQDEQRCDILILTGALTGNRNAIVDATPWRWAAVINNTTGAFNATLKVTGLTGVLVAQTTSIPLVCNGTDVIDAASGIRRTTATQSEQEAGSNSNVFTSPGTQQYHPSAAKAWVMFDAAGNMNASYNMASVTDGGTGVFTPNWSVDFSSAAYAVLATLQKNVGGVSTTLICQTTESGQLAGSCALQVVDVGVVARDPLSVYCVAFGDQ